MVDLDMVIAGLKCCTQDHCDPKDCPYFCESRGCEDIIKTDALTLLETYKPRVLTIEEAKSLQHNDIVWIDIGDIGMLEPQIVDKVVNGYLRFRNWLIWNFDKDRYGAYWRVWNAKPTDKQREEAKWDEVD